jgi:dTMP kinase
LQGRLIVFEGGEGAGKSTQLQQLADWLGQGDRLQRWGWAGVKCTREPGGTALGVNLRQMLLGQETEPTEPLDDRAELLLYAADRAQHVGQRLRPWLAQGYLVLCDRFTASTVAYQGYGRGGDLALIDQLNQVATAGLSPDLVLWLDVAVAVGLERAQSRGDTNRMEAAAIAFHQQVRSGFLAQAQAQPQRFVAIDGGQPVAAVAAAIQVVMAQRLDQWRQIPSQP